MRLSLGYSDESDLKPLLPLLEGKINRDIYIEPIKIKENEIKFQFHSFDIVYMSLPLINHLPGVRFISNGAKVTERIGIRGKCEKQVCVNDFNSTEYFFMRIFDSKRQVNKGENCECKVEFENIDEDLTALWKEKCGDLPIVLKLIAANMDDSQISRVKVAIRESASLMIDSNLSQFSKELG
ncbi:MAG: hypothetical protein QXH41_02575, partial [Metallosphaera sp.]